MRYSIKAIPTEYGGVRFRSRLEARWAAFFDRMGYSWDYEPFDLSGWTPDFVLRNLNGQPSVLIEVKPVEVNVTGHYRVLEDVAAKAIAHSQEHLVVCCGLAPIQSSKYSAECGTGEDLPGLDRLAAPDRWEVPPAIGSGSVLTYRIARIGVLLERLPIGPEYLCTAENPDVVRRAWAAAGNDTQWRR